MSLAEPRLVLPVRARRRHWQLPGARLVVLGLSGALTLAIGATFGLSILSWTPAATLALCLVVLTALWISGGAATALVGAIVAPPKSSDPPPAWRPESRTAILVLLCKEDPKPLAAHLAALDRGLGRVGLRDATEVFVLSDTSGRDAILREEAAFFPLLDAGRLHYRRRAENTGRKPGNIADWFATHGAAFDHMLVLDADSRMAPARIRRMIRQMDGNPALGLLQAGISLRPGRTRFGRHQRTAARLLSPGFGRGFAAWSGASGNYWGHNAIIRTAAFRSAARLPALPGRAPMGGALLSHDFVEAAWIRRAGWEVRLDPDSRGSAEDAPQTMADYQARDRRWCQGNLQHLRLLTEPGLDPISRLHLGLGALSYLVAPVWLILLGLMLSGAVALKGWLALALVAGVLLMPKLCALAALWRRARTVWRRRVLLGAALGELVVSSLLTPLMMLRQAGSVLLVCLGRDCGWKADCRPRSLLPQGCAEALAGIALLGSGVALGGGAVLWVLPVALPLVCAPALLAVMDAPA